MTEQQLMHEMLKKGIHSMTIQSYRGNRNADRTYPKDLPDDNVEWLQRRVDETIKYGRGD